VKAYTDRNGRSLVKQSKKEIEDLSITCVTKLGANFSTVTSECLKDCRSMTSRDLVVLSAGANDVSKDESQNFLSSLKKQLHSLTHTNVLLYNIPHRYDLIPESCVNAEIERVNKEMHVISRHFRNVKIIEISKLGRRFHDHQGLN
jgi:hypothetical protein